jgi:hypothetical protein
MLFEQIIAVCTQNDTKENIKMQIYRFNASGMCVYIYIYIYMYIYIYVYIYIYINLGRFLTNEVLPQSFSFLDHIQLRHIR